MNLIYNAVLTLAKSLTTALARLSKGPGSSKFCRFTKGQLHILDHIREELSACKDRCPEEAAKPVIWIHAASLGEFGVARPIIRRIQEQGRWRVVLTFFSPSGYEATRHKADRIGCNIFYLPLDTARNARTFLDLVKPEKAVFIISEVWINYLHELYRRQIPTYMISSVITQKSVFCKWYGWTYRRALKTYTAITVLNEESKAQLEKLGYHRAVLTSDPLYDNVITAARTPYSNPVAERFVQGFQGKVFMAGSTSDTNDVRLVAHLANTNPDIRFIIAPHEITGASISELQSSLKGPTVLMSECQKTIADAAQSLPDAQVLIVDTLGELAYLYRYATWAYIGGGFTPYLHNLLEATIYGIPVSFGPEIYRKCAAEDLLRLGAGKVVTDEKEISGWFTALKNDSDETDRLGRIAKEYSESKSGATDIILEIITAHTE